MHVVGAVGHRVLADVEKLQQSVNEVVDRLRRKSNGESPIVLSALAEGADRMIANAMISRAGARLIAVLPFVPEEYEKDFSSLSSRNDFERLLEVSAETVVMRAAESRDAGYEKAANYIVENCNVVIALWDGQPAQGVGGTAHAVAKARAKGLPLIWINAGNRVAGTLNPTVTDKQGEVSYERIDF